MKTLLCTILLLVALTIIQAATLHVALDGSQPFSAIQTAIEASNHGDMVLVHPGRYYENIDYIGKSITVCSMEATTNDTTYISSTIIDGNQSGSCVAFRNHEDNATLRGFTITNGIGYRIPAIDDSLHRGGGIVIFCTGQINIQNCVIVNNRSGIGGGICLVQSSLLLSGLQIYNNYAIALGGGISMMGGPTNFPSITFDPDNLCSVYSNYSANPADISIIDIRVNLLVNLDMFTLATPETFYIARHSNTPVYEQYSDTVNIQRGYRTEVNHDLYVSPSGNDDNTGLNPSEAMKTITKAIHRIASDSLAIKTVHVLPGTYQEGVNDQILPIPLKSNVNIIGEGSDITTIVANPMTFTSQTIFFYGADCTNIKLQGFNAESIVSEGNWLLGLMFGSKNVRISDIVAQNMTVIHYGTVFIMDFVSSVIDSLVLKNITTPEVAVLINDGHSYSVRNSIFESILSTYSSPDTPGDDSWGQCVFTLWVADSLSVQNCIFSNISVFNNQSTFYIAHRYDHNPPLIPNINVDNCILENIRTNAPCAINFTTNRFGEYEVSNCTFYGNYGLGGAVGIYGNVKMRNNVFHNPETPRDIVMYQSYPQLDWIGNLDFDYNCIPEGETRIYNTDPANTVIFGDHNIMSDPLFVSTDPGSPFYLHLAADSPCINTGTPDTTGLDLPPYDLAGNWRVWNGRIDMGCYEFGSEPWVSNDDPVVPEIPAIKLVAYPNPFQTSSNIKISIPVEYSNKMTSISETSIDIYNIKGQKVKSISFDPRSSLEQVIVWDGKDQHGNNCTSGLYIINLIIAGEHLANRKVTLVK
ncbi:MAG: DUF1565 domain-containing protein [Candidatus Cloacimonetes bacterium]|nr:DUF1565 domain-containing protein [Candidatus Cloacimonadota bacterium]